MHLAQLVINTACPENRFLDEMKVVVPWSLFEEALCQGIVRKTGGRPPYALLLLFKMHLLQVWFGLSDVQCCHQVQDRLSFRRFLDLGIDSLIPEATTLENFRHDFEPLAARVFAQLDDFFKEKGLLLKEGNMIDATFIRANSRPHKNKAKNSDQEAEHGHKGFGYTTSINGDVKTKLIRKIHVSSARAHDSQHVDAVLIGDEAILYGDSGYQGTQKKLAERGCIGRMIAKKTRGKAGEKGPELRLRDKYLNKLYSKLRVRVEHVFGSWKTLYKVKRAWYRGLTQVKQQMHSLALAYNLRRYGFLTRAQCA